MGTSGTGTVLVVLQSSQKVRVVIRGEECPCRDARLTPRTTEEKPQDRPEERHTDEDEDPNRFGKVAHTGRGRQRPVDQRVDVKNDEADAGGNRETHHPSIVALRGGV